MNTNTIPTKRKVGRPKGTYAYGEPLRLAHTYLFARQIAAVEEIARARHLSIAAMYRAIIDDYLARHPPAPIDGGAD